MSRAGWRFQRDRERGQIELVYICAEEGRGMYLKEDSKHGVTKEEAKCFPKRKLMDMVRGNADSW